MPTLRVIARALILLLLLPAGGPQAQPESFVRYSAPEFLTFPELVSLSKDPTPEGALKKKVEAVFHTPIISNEAWFAGVRPRHLHDVRLGQFMRVASWNIEKSLHVPEAIQVFTSRIDFEKMIDLEKAAPGSKELKVALRQRDRLAEADILILQEMEIGVKRSGYLNAAAEMAEALQMNYAYGTQYLEVDPVNLGLETLLYEEGQPDLEAMEYYREDPERYKGLFGSAVLSRYPIKSVELKPLKTQPYDWYWGEKENLS